MTDRLAALKIHLVCLLLAWLAAAPAFGNLPGGGTGSAAPVTLTSNPAANPPTVTLANGIVTVVIDTYSSQILSFTYNGNQVTGGGTGGNDDINWQGQAPAGVQEGANGVLTILTNTGDFAEIQIANLYSNQGTTNAYAADAYYYFAMFSGSPGIYVAEDMERSTNTGSASVAGGADIPSLTCQLWGTATWLGQDNGRFLLRETPADSAAAIPGINNCPKEVTLLDQGLLSGQFECKYDFSGDLNALHFAGWATDTLSTNIGFWLIHPSREYFSGGPKHPEIVGQIDMINCTFKSVHFGFGSDLNFTNGETWSRVCGPVFFYANQVPPGTANPQLPLYADAQAQAAAEAGAWPYTWFTADTNYAPASARGVVAGKLVINDSGNPSASAAGLWVGVEQQPPSSLSPPTTDFQDFSKNYQYWVQTDANGNFSIPNVVAGTNYTLLAFGPGAIGLYQSQSFGAAPPVQLFIPPTPFAISVTGGQTNSLGNVTWSPTRVGATVWEIGVPDRDTTEFRHGADYWHGDLGNATNYPVNWAQWQDYNLDFPNGVNFTNGVSRWSVDWDYAQPTSLDPTTGNLNGTTRNIFFNLPGAPAGSSQASLYFAISGDYSGPVVVTVNGTTLNGTGTFPYYSSDPMIRMESHGIFCDFRQNFAGNLLKQGQNEIQLNMRKGGYFSDDIMYDYLRLELTGYVPPAPAGLTALAGNGLVVLDWPASSGANSYNVLRSTVSGGGYTLLATNVVGPVVGGDVPDATYADNAAVNGTTYYYVVTAVNPNGQSADSTPATATPSASTPAAPPAPAGLTATPGDQQVALTWNAATGAATYTLQRTVITGGANPNDPGAAVATLPNGAAPTNVVNAFITTTNYTDRGLADNVTYAYTVSAANANGQSAASAAVTAVTEPALPATPAGLAATVTTNQVNLAWNPVGNAASYVLQRATAPAGPYTLIYYPGWLSLYADGPLAYNTTYYYEVASANLAGFSTNSAPLAVTLGPAAPASLIAVPGNTQVTLLWGASAGATNYVLERSTVSGGPYASILSTTNTSEVNTGLANGTTYYYVVSAVGPYGPSPLSSQANATPFAGPAGIYWINTITASPQGWNVSTNWSNLTAFPNSTQALAIVNTAISAAQTIDLNQAITLGQLNIGSSGGAAAYNVTGAGGALTLDNTPGEAVLMQLATSRGYTISAPVTINGSVTLSGTNTFTGGTTLNPGCTLYPGGTVANNSAWGAGPVTFNGGTLQFYGYGGSGGTDWGGCSNTFNVPYAQTGAILLPGRFGYTTQFTSALTGGGTFNVTVEYVRDFFTGNWSAFTGRINVSAGPSNPTGDFRVNNPDGYAGAALYLNDNVNLYNINASGQTTSIGELGGASGAYIGGGSGASANPTWSIGARNTTNTFAGTIADSGVSSLVKVGTGTLILTGANTFSGGATVSSGALLVNNPAGSGTGVGPVTVAGGGWLGGTGIISNSVTVNAGGVLAPGNPLGTLTLSNNLTLAAGATVAFQVQPSPVTNNVLKVAGTLTKGGTLFVTNSSGTALASGNSFKLFSAGVGAGAFASVILPPLPAGLAWNTNTLNTSGTLSIVTLTHPLIQTLSLGTGGLVIGGSGGLPGGGYTVLATTNLLLPVTLWTPLLTNQFDSSGNFTFTNEVNPGSSPNFLLLQAP